MLRLKPEELQRSFVRWLLRLLDLSGCAVTLDAMGTQHEIAQQIIEQGADWVLAVKENQPSHCEEVGLFFASAPQPNGERERVDEELRCEAYRPVDKDHGRFEIREVRVVEKFDNGI